MGSTPDSTRVESVGPLSPRHLAGETTPPPRVLVFSDVRLFREGLALGLRGRGDVVLVGTADSFDAVWAAVIADTPDVVLLDTGMSHALHLARELRRASNTTRIVGISVGDDGADVLACGEAGMAGFLSRDASIDDVLAVIHDVMRDELQCSPRMAATLFKRLASAGAASALTTESPTLTPREVEIVSCIDRGLSNKQIAHRLRISVATVKNHVHSILEKLQVTRRAEAAAQLRGSRAGIPARPRRDSKEIAI